MQPNLLFQYCQKIVVLSHDQKSVLLAKRNGEADYDGVFSFIGGKKETTDRSIIDGIKREKDEEIGTGTRIKIAPNETYNLLFRKKDGNSMILPHIAAIYKVVKLCLAMSTVNTDGFRLTSSTNLSQKLKIYQRWI